MNLEHVFVYGTLKRGQCRECCWPHLPVETQPAWTYGKLIDLGSYPGLLAGQDRVLGEVWSFHTAQINKVFDTLDRVEVTNQPGIPNEYNRIRINVQLLEKRETIVASCYLYAHPESAEKYKLVPARMSADQELFVVWP